MLVPVVRLCRTFLLGQGFTNVSSQVPEPRPVRWVQLQRTGGSAINRVLEIVQITVTCWAGSDVDAESDAMTVRMLFLEKYTLMSLVRGVEEVSGPYSDPDPDSGSPRYSFTVRLRVRGRR